MLRAAPGAAGWFGGFGLLAPPGSAAWTRRRRQANAADRLVTLVRVGDCQLGDRLWEAAPAVGQEPLGAGGDRGREMDGVGRADQGIGHMNRW